MAAWLLFNKFDFVAFGRVNKGERSSARTGRRAVGKFQAVLREVLGKCLKVVHLEREMGEVGLHLHRAAAQETSDFNQLLATGRVQKDQFESIPFLKDLQGRLTKAGLK